MYNFLKTDGTPTHWMDEEEADGWHRDHKFTEVEIRTTMTPDEFYSYADR